MLPTHVTYCTGMRLIQSERLAQALLRPRRGRDVAAGHHVDDVARQQPQHAEDEQRHPDQRRDEQPQPPQDVAAHGSRGGRRSPAGGSRLPQASTQESFEDVRDVAREAERHVLHPLRHDHVRRGLDRPGCGPSRSAGCAGCSCRSPALGHVGSRQPGVDQRGQLVVLPALAEPSREHRRGRIELVEVAARIVAEAATR